MIRNFLGKAKKIVCWFGLIVLAIVLIAFMMANREIVTVFFNPLDIQSGAMSFRLPLFIWLFLFLIIGIFIGRISVWLRLCLKTKSKTDAHQLQDSSYFIDPDDKN